MPQNASTNNPEKSAYGIDKGIKVWNYSLASTSGAYMTTEAKSEMKPPYVAYKTFANTLASLRESGLPDRIDRSVFPGLAGGTQSFLMSALKFMGLIIGEGTPSET